MKQTSVPAQLLINEAHPVTWPESRFFFIFFNTILNAFCADNKEEKEYLVSSKRAQSAMVLMTGLMHEFCVALRFVDR